MEGTKGRGKTPEGAIAADEPALEASSRLNAAFVREVLADWERHGAAAIASVRAERPHDYLKLITGLFPKEGEGRAGELDALTDEQLAGELARTLAQLAAASADPGAGAGAPEAAQSPGDLPSLS